jgi:hypothetical protein
MHRDKRNRFLFASNSRGLSANYDSRLKQVKVLCLHFLNSLVSQMRDCTISLFIYQQSRKRGEFCGPDQREHPEHPSIDPKSVGVDWSRSLRCTLLPELESVRGSILEGAPDCLSPSVSPKQEGLELHNTYISKCRLLFQSQLAKQKSMQLFTNLSQNSQLTPSVSIHSATSDPRYLLVLLLPCCCSLDV